MDEPNEKDNHFLTLPEVQTYLGIKSRKTILKYIRDGKLAAYKLGGTRWRISYDDVHAFLKKEFIEIAAARPETSAAKSAASAEVAP